MSLFADPDDPTVIQLKAMWPIMDNSNAEFRDRPDTKMFGFGPAQQAQEDLMIRALAKSLIRREMIPPKEIRRRLDGDVLWIDVRA